jgi:calcineurin-like phosphoesterase
MRILILGDVMGRPARRAVRELVPGLIREEKIDLAIANAENAAGGMGVDIKSAGELFAAGINVLTSGNHIWKKKEIYAFLEDQSICFAREYPEGRPVRVAESGGKGWSLMYKGEFSCLTMSMTLSVVSIGF